ncbi:MAG: lysophospholipid acyltransferase family protein [Balneolaceae bacterium]|nr:lysophospholipid acyltransferase family protein [Balneolaceae bacterium]
MGDGLKSVVIWMGVGLLVLLWLPMMGVRRLADRDPARYGTGRLFRRLGLAISRLNPYWNISISGHRQIDDRRPYVMVCNHLSQADIPLISNLPWEMKWIAKKELFSFPFVGWMMRLAGDIPVNRSALNRKSATLSRAEETLKQRCSVIFFPEGTRSRNGRMNRFTTGAFELAIRQQVPVLPMVIDGTQNCLPKNSWKFGSARNIRLQILEPVSTEGLSSSQNEIMELRNRVRDRIRDRLASLREEEPHRVDNTLKEGSS